MNENTINETIHTNVEDLGGFQVLEELSLRNDSHEDTSNEVLVDQQSQ